MLNLSLSRQITTYATVSSEHATYLSIHGDPDASSDDEPVEKAFGSSIASSKKASKAKPTPTKKKAASSNPLCALFETKWHRIVLGEFRVACLGLR